MISEKYKDLYLSTARGQIKKMNDLLLYLEKRPNNQNVLENIFRLIHSMKGAAATMAYRKTVELCHAWENVVDAAYHQDIELSKKTIDLFFNTTAVLEKNLLSIEKNNKEIDLKSAINNFRTFFKVKTKSKKPNITREKHILGSLPSVAEITISTDKLDKIKNHLDDLLINVMAAKDIVKDSGQSKLLSICLSADKILGDLRRDLENIRIVPIKQIFSALPYLVREVARNENKKVDFVIRNNNLSLDKAILDELVEIVIQLLKNAVAHGITSEQKSAKIVLEVSLINDRLQLTVEDNGQGIDWRGIISLAIKNKLVTRSAARNMSSEAAKDLLFMPGISRGQNLSTSSGRGVGLSLVKTKVQELDGHIDVISKPGKGATFIITLPLPLTVFRALVFRRAEYILALPLSYIDQIVKLEELRDFSQATFWQSGRSRFRLIDLEKKLDLPNFRALYKYVATLKYQDTKLALPIYSNISEAELIMKKTPKFIKNNKYIKGVAVSAQGQPILVLDINSLV